MTEPPPPRGIVKPSDAELERLGIVWVDLAGVTPSGLPYPASSDPVANGAANIQALAEAIDTYQGGAGLQSNTAGNGPTLPSGVWTLVYFYTPLAPPRGDAVTVTNEYTLTINRAGLYYVFGHTEWAAAAGGRAFQVTRNGANGTRTPVSQNVPPGSGTRPYLSASAMWELAAGDVLTMYAWQDSGANQAIIECMMGAFLYSK